MREEYDAVKRRAAATAADIDAYLLLKSETLERILQQAGLSEDERAAIAETNRRISERGAIG